jgi:hypothetical protein
MRWHLNQQYSTAYDIPPGLFDEERSPAFAGFFEHWFVNIWAVSRHELELGFLEDMSPQEKDVAKDLLRRNLHLKYTHIIEGVAALHDLEAVPILREMAAIEMNPSRRLTMAGTLWKLVQDPLLVDCLTRMKKSDNVHLRSAHLRQVLWLRDERSVDLLIDFLDDSDKFVRLLALSALNEVEFEENFLVPANQLPRQPDEYRTRRDDGAFRKMMVAHLRRSASF